MTTLEKDISSSRLEHVYQEAQGIEEQFNAVLLIPTESYDAPLITLVEGLSALGVTIYTIKKPNINSWFANEVVEGPEGLDFDFVLSSIHWGTRWSYYDKYNLHSEQKVLLDGSDTIGGLGWRGKQEALNQRYVKNPPEEVKNKQLSPFRWVEPIGDYEPDAIFTCQKVSEEGSYFPFGIHQAYSNWYKDKTFDQKGIDFTHIPGIGNKRETMRDFIENYDLPGVIRNDGAWGTKRVPNPIREIASADLEANVHSYHRWVFREDYFELLNNTRALIYPGVRTRQWDSKRPWEAMANGCLVLYEIDIDNSEYPLQEICPFAEYETLEELVDKAEYLHSRPDFFERQSRLFFKRGIKYFNPISLARYFLWRLNR